MVKRYAIFLELIYLHLIAAVPLFALLVSNIYPRHDALFQYQFLSYIYENFKVDKVIPVWIPFLGYGQTSSQVDLSIMSPMHCLAVLIGYLLNITDSLQVYWLAIYFSQVFFIIVMYLLAREAGLSKINASIAVFPLSLTMELFKQPYFQINSYAGIFFTILLSIYFFKSRKLYILLVSLALCPPFLLFGDATYWLIVKAYILIIWAIFLIVENYTQSINKNKFVYKLTRCKTFCVFLSLILAMASFSLFMWKVIDVLFNHKVVSIGRDINGYVSIKDFLEYPYMLNPIDQLLSYISGPSPTREFSLFVGKVALSIIIVFLIKLVHDSKEKSGHTRFFLPILLTTITVVIFSLPGLTSFDSYVFYLPFMNSVRHVAYSANITIPLIMMLVFYSCHQIYEKKYIIAAILIVFGFNLLLNDGVNIYLNLLIFISLLLFSYNIMFRKEVLLILMVFETLLHYSYFNDIYKFQISSDNINILKHNKIYSAQTFTPDNINRRSDDLKSAIYLSTTSYRENPELHDVDARYSFQNSFLGQDICFPNQRSDLYVSSIVKLRSFVDQNKLSNECQKLLLSCDSSKVISGNVKDYYSSYEFLDNSCGLNESNSEVYDGERPFNLYYESNINKSPTVLLYSANKIVIKNDGSSNVIAIYDAYHPWWNANADGVSLKIKKFNIGFKAVEVDKSYDKIIIKISDIYVYAQLFFYVFLSAMLVIAYLFLISSIFVKGGSQNKLIFSFFSCLK